MADPAVRAGHAGVVVIGAVSSLVPGWFPDATAWSRFGSGYGFVPPVPGLVWIRRASGGNG